MYFPIAFFTGMPGPVEFIIIGAIALLLFGNRLPSVMRSVGRSIVEFKKGIKGIEDDVNDAGNNDNKPDTKETTPK